MKELPCDCCKILNSSKNYLAVVFGWFVAVEDKSNLSLFAWYVFYYLERKPSTHNFFQWFQLKQLLTSLSTIYLNRPSLKNWIGLDCIWSLCYFLLLEFLMLYDKQTVNRFIIFITQKLGIPIRNTWNGPLMRLN